MILIFIFKKKKKKNKKKKDNSTRSNSLSPGHATRWLLLNDFKFDIPRAFEYKSMLIDIGVISEGVGEYFLEVMPVFKDKVYSSLKKPVSVLAE